MTARTIVSPGCMERIYNALAENTTWYEDAFGNIEVAQEPGGTRGYVN